MDREILKYLYEFYRLGDYVGFHDLTPLFERLRKKNDFKILNDRLKTILGYLEMNRWINLNTTDYGSWGTVKEGNTLFDYTHIPVSARITEEGAAMISGDIVAERQERVDNSVLRTNKASWVNFGTTILFGLIVTTIQIRSCTRDIAKDSQEARKAYSDSLRQSQQSKHDSLIESAILQLIPAKKDTSSKKRTF